MREDNFINYNVFVLIESLLLYYFFYKIFRSGLYNNIVKGFTVIFLAAWVAYFRKLGTINFVDVAVTIQNITIITLSVLYFYEQITDIDPTPHYTQSRFWIVVAYFIFSSSSFFYYIFISSLPQSEQVTYNALFFAISLLRYILLMVAMFVKPKPPAHNKFQLT